MHGRVTSKVLTLLIWTQADKLTGADAEKVFVKVRGVRALLLKSMTGLTSNAMFSPDLVRSKPKRPATFGSTDSKTEHPVPLVQTLPTSTCKLPSTSHPGRLASSTAQALFHSRLSSSARTANRPPS